MDDGAGVMMREGRVGKKNRKTCCLQASSVEQVDRCRHSGLDPTEDLASVFHQCQLRSRVKSNSFGQQQMEKDGHRDWERDKPTARE